MKIFLIGLPGSGKSTLGKSLAGRLGYPCVDLDAAIEGSQGKSVKDIFRDDGEGAFRELEGEMLRSCMASNPDFVMATGGGTPCFGANLQTMNDSGVSIFLDVSPEEIAKRFGIDQSAERPLLSLNEGESLVHRLNTLRAQRLPFYQKATHSVTSDIISVEDLIVLLDLK